MTIIFHFLIGFISSFIGSTTPSMLNMMALKVSLTNHKKAGKQFVFGVSFIVFFQAGIAILLFQYFFDNPLILETIEKFGIVIFIGLSFYFFKISKKEPTALQQTSIKKQNAFLNGVVLSVLNMFSIPFYVGIVATLDLFNFFNFEVFTILFFALGSVLGTYYILILYVRYAEIIQKKTVKITKNINLILSILTGFMAVLMILKLMYKMINS